MPVIFRHNLIGNYKIDGILASKNLDGFLVGMGLEDGVAQIFSKRSLRPTALMS